DAINRAEEIARIEKIDCDFMRVDGYLFPAGKDTRETLEKEQQACECAGLSDVVIVHRAPVDSFDTGPCLRFPRQGQFHPLKYLAAMARGCQREGSSIFADTRVEGIQGGVPARIETRHGAIVTADAVVVATNTPINDRVAIHTKQAPYISYAIGANVPAGVLPKALYWDTGHPYHYIRLAAADDVAMELL